MASGAVAPIRLLVYDTWPMYTCGAVVTTGRVVRTAHDQVTLRADVRRWRRTWPTASPRSTGSWPPAGTATSARSFWSSRLRRGVTPATGNDCSPTRNPGGGAPALAACCWRCSLAASDPCSCWRWRNARRPIVRTPPTPMRQRRWLRTSRSMPRSCVAWPSAAESRSRDVPRRRVRRQYDGLVSNLALVLGVAGTASTPPRSC